MSTKKPAAAAGGGQELQRYQKEMLGKLRVLRDSLDTERAPFAKMQAERDQAVADKAKVLPKLSLDSIPACDGFAHMRGSNL